jgi:hypothetical protein
MEERGYAPRVSSWYNVCMGWGCCEELGEKSGFEFQKCILNMRNASMEPLEQFRQGSGYQKEAWARYICIYTHTHMWASSAWR